MELNKYLGKPRGLDSRNRVTLPKEVLDLLDMKSSDEVFFKEEGNKIIVGKAIKRYEYLED